MQRDSRAYLSDILESCDAISTALSGMQIDDYLSNRLVRSSVGPPERLQPGKIM